MDYGLWKSGIDLVSPLLGDPDTLIGVGTFGVRRGVILVRSPNPNFGFVIHSFFLPTPDAPHYPFGYDVVPD